MKFVVLLCLLMMAVTIIDCKFRNGAAKGGKGKLITKTRSEAAGLLFSVRRVYNLLRKGRYTCVGCIRPGAAEYLTAVLQDVTAEILKLAIKAAHDDKKSRIVPRHVQQAVRDDEELYKLLGGVTMASGGVLPNIQAVKKTKREAVGPGENRAVKKARRKKESYSTYILKVMKQINPDVSMSSNAMSIMNAFVIDIYHRLASAASLLYYQRRYKEGKEGYINYRDFQTAVFQIFPEELAKHADSAGTKAVTKYLSS